MERIGADDGLQGVALGGDGLDVGGAEIERHGLDRSAALGSDLGQTTTPGSWLTTRFR
jgi:hypothetical protein